MSYTGNKYEYLTRSASSNEQLSFLDLRDLADDLRALRENPVSGGSRMERLIDQIADDKPGGPALLEQVKVMLRRGKSTVKDTRRAESDEEIISSIERALENS